MRAGGSDVESVHDSGDGNDSNNRLNMYEMEEEDEINESYGYSASFASFINQTETLGNIETS